MMRFIFHRFGLMAFVFSSLTTKPTPAATS